MSTYNTDNNKSHMHKCIHANTNKQDHTVLSLLSLLTLAPPFGPHLTTTVSRRVGIDMVASAMNNAPMFSLNEWG